MIVYSCSENTVGGRTEISEGYVGVSEVIEHFQIEIQDLGEMHTEVLENFNAQHRFIIDGRLHVDDYIDICAKSINQSLDSRNIEFTITNSDVIEVLNVFIDLRDKGVADLFTVSDDVPVELFDYAVDNNLLVEDEAEQYVEFLDEIKIQFDTRDKTEPIQKLSKSCVTGDPGRDIAFTDIAYSSAEFWHHVIVVSESDTTQPPVEIDIEKLDTVMLMYWDASWTMIGGILGGPIGAFVGFMIASTAFVIWGDDLMGPIYDDLN
jgi:hypothetical protein